MCKSYEHMQSQDQYKSSPCGPEQFQWANPKLFQVFQKARSFSLLLPMISFHSCLAHVLGIAEIK